MKVIVVPVDLSANSAKALKVAHALTLKAKAKLLVFHHYSYTSAIISNTEPQIFDSLLAEIEEQVQLDLSSFVKKHLGDTNQNVVLKPVQGFGITDTLIEFVKKNKADLIVMGTQGASGLKRLVVGSYATQTIKSSPVPVLVIPKNFKPKDFNKIAYASDLAAIDKELSLIIPFAELVGGMIDIVHIDPLFPKPEAAKKFKPEDKLAQLRTKHPKCKFSFTPIVTKVANDFHGGMSLYKRRAKPDLLVIIKHKRTWLDNILNPSRTIDLAYQAQVPLLCINS